MEKLFKTRHLSKNRIVFDVFNTLFFAFMLISIILPFIFILGQSLSNRDLGQLKLLPVSNRKFLPDIIAYKFEFNRAFLISVFTTFMTTVIGTIISSISAFILIQRKMPGRKIFSCLLLFTLSFDAGLIPLFLVIKKIGLFDSLWAVILPISINVYNIVFMRSYFESLPKCLFDAAEIDGCSSVWLFIRVLLPISKPALAAVALFFAAAAWNEYFAYVMYINDVQKYNLQYMIRDLFTDRTCRDEPVYEKTLACAKILAAALPVSVMCLFAQKYYSPALSLASVKE